jgi:UDP-N-acetyl-D-galactosamine dehydrogenase
LKPLLAASETVGRALKRGDIVVYESTVYPGATEEDCVPVLERASSLRCGDDFRVGYSPERINPGDPSHRFPTITKVVSGQDPETLETVARVYESVVTAGVHRAPSIRVAEAAKVIENTQRDLNIALMNELAVIFGRMGIDTSDVLQASRTKWNFLPFSPGLVGGHCIGVDPYYLTHKAILTGYIPQVILAGRRINDGMGGFVAEQVVKQLIRQGYDAGKALVTVLGLSFKENVPDLRNTRVIDIVRALEDYGIRVQVHDPVASAHEARSELGVLLTDFADLLPARCVVLAVAHREYVDGGWPLIGRLLDGSRGVVADVKSVLPRGAIPDGVSLWRL